MKLEYQVIAAFGLDLLLGDPRWLPHPVRLIGRFALALESPLRRQ
jgi:adenosylcobinamide-phosphate synthase